MSTKYFLERFVFCRPLIRRVSVESSITLHVLRSFKTRSFKKISSKMPKNNTAAAELKEQRLKAKNSSPKKILFAPSEIYLCVLGNGASNSSRALYMFTDHGRYLFNCGEGTQRLAHEYKMKLAKLDNIFITHKSWDNVGGLLGLCLTVQDIGVPEIYLHGPPGTDELFKKAGSFIVTNTLNIVGCNNFEKGFVDGCMQITYIPIYPTPVSRTDDSFKCDFPEPLPKKICTITSYREMGSDMVVAYACKGHSKPGQLLIEKCVEQGVPPGPLLGDLKNGKDVVLPCGKIVYSKDVVSEEQPCPLFLVVECPSQRYLRNFVGEKKFRKYQVDSPSSTVASLVVHFTPPEILNTDLYREWMERFPDTTCHLIINSDNATVASAAVHRIQHKLHLIHPEIFPLLHENPGKPIANESPRMNIIQANTLDRYLLRPAKGFDRSFSVDFDPQIFIDEALNTEGFKDCLSDLKICIQENLDVSPFYGNPFPEVIFLGTGSSIPSKVRNVSAILVRVCKFEYFLMDCGEGTSGQLMRILGGHYDFVLEHLIGVFISHMHADHHLGLIQVLKAREKVFDPNMFIPLLIIGPKKLKTWLDNYNSSFERISSLYSFIESSSLEYGYGKYTEDAEVDRFTFFDLCISTVPVNHCPDAYGLIMTDKFVKWKLVYSGDTLPCDKLVTAGKNCTLLIHEATMEDELEEEAALKKHCTTSQAIEISERMNAKHTILTHFSQRYAKVPIINENFNNQIGCAFDNMRASRREFSILPLLIPTLKCLFAENVQEMMLKGDKRRKKQELLSQLAAVK